MLKNAVNDQVKLVNLGYVDRVSRFLIGAALVASVYILTTPAELSWALYLPLVGLYPLTTAMVGWDPLYAILGVNTNVKSVTEAAMAKAIRQTAYVLNGGIVESEKSRVGNDSQFYTPTGRSAA